MTSPSNAAVTIAGCKKALSGSRMGPMGAVGLALGMLTGCSSLSDQMPVVEAKYAGLPGHKALVYDANDDRLVWVSGKGTQLDAIQLAQILCERAAMDADACKLVQVDDVKLYDPIADEAFPPNSPELADVLYEAGVPAKHAEPAAQ